MAMNISDRQLSSSTQSWFFLPQDLVNRCNYVSKVSPHLSYEKELASPVGLAGKYAMRLSHT